MSNIPRMGPEDALLTISQIIQQGGPEVFPPKNTSGVSDAQRKVEQYQCSICRDAHIVHPRKVDGKPDYSRSVPCRCVLEQWERDRARHLLATCELPAASGHMTLERFVQRPGLEEAYAEAMKAADYEAPPVDVSDPGAAGPWLTFMADTSRGKTHLAVAICRGWLARGKVARYAYVPLLLEELRSGFQRQEGENSYGVRFDAFLNVPLLVLDDLGTENRTPWVQEKLDTLVDYRLMHGLGLVVTTNCPLERLPFRLANRLERRGKIVYINAEEYLP